MNIDLKGFTPEYYRWLNGDLETVKAAIELCASRCHVEVTTLIVPGRNDSEADMDAGSRLALISGGDVPLHISRFFPDTVSPTLPHTGGYRVPPAGHRGGTFEIRHTGNC